MIQARYGATDLYVVCLLKPVSEEINIIDKREVHAAQWVPLSELKSNDSDAKYKLFPNAWKFINGIQGWIQQKENDRKLPLSEDMTANDVVMTCSLIHEDFEPTQNATVVTKAKWNYYLPSLMKQKL